MKFAHLHLSAPLGLLGTSRHHTCGCNMTGRREEIEPFLLAASDMTMVSQHSECKDILIVIAIIIIVIIGIIVIIIIIIIIIIIWPFL